MANPNQAAFYFNQDRCVGCRACEGACKQENNLPVEVRYRRVIFNLNHMPACVVTCMGLALFSAKLSDLDAGNLPDNISDPHLSKKVPDFPDPRLTNPAIRFTLAKNV